MYKFFHFEAMHFSYHKAQLVSAATRFLLNAFSTIFKLKTTDNSILHLTSKLKKEERRLFCVGGGEENSMLKISPLESVYISYQMSTPFSFFFKPEFSIFHCWRPASKNPFRNVCFMHEFRELSTAFHVLPGREFSFSINMALPEKYAAEFREMQQLVKNQVIWACLWRYNMQEILNFLEAVQMFHVINKELNHKHLILQKHNYGN